MIYFNYKNLKILSAILETLCWLPFLWWVFFITTSWQIILVLIIIHFITLFLSIKEWKLSIGSNFWIVINFFTWIPIIWTILHFLISIILWLEIAKENKK